MISRKLLYYSFALHCSRFKIFAGIISTFQIIIIHKTGIWVLLLVHTHIFLLSISILSLMKKFLSVFLLHFYICTKVAATMNNFSTLFHTRKIKIYIVLIPPPYMAYFSYIYSKTKGFSSNDNYSLCVIILFSKIFRIVYNPLILFL